MKQEIRSISGHHFDSASAIVGAPTFCSIVDTPT